MFFEKAVKIMILFCRVQFADPSIMINENVGLELGVGDYEAIMEHGFIGLVSIYDAVETWNNIPHIWTIDIRHGAL